MLLMRPWQNQLESVILTCICAVALSVSSSGAVVGADCLRNVVAALPSFAVFHDHMRPGVGFYCTANAGTAMCGPSAPAGLSVWNCYKGTIAGDGHCPGTVHCMQDAMAHV